MRRAVSPYARTLLCALRPLGANTKASVVAEFALILPVLLIVIGASFWAVVALDASRKNSVAATRIADVMARHLTVSRERLERLHQGLASIYSPQDLEDATVVVSVVRVRRTTSGERSYSIVWQTENGLVNSRPTFTPTPDQENLLLGIPIDNFFVFVTSSLVHRPLLGGFFGVVPTEMQMGAFAFNLTSDPLSGITLN